MVVWSMRVMVVVGVRSMGMVIMVSVRRMRVCAEQNTRSLQRRRIGERARRGEGARWL